MANNLKLVKLVSGLELIGDCVYQDETGVSLQTAFQVVVQPVSETQFSLGLAPLSVAVLGAEKGLPITPRWAEILGVYAPVDVLCQTYQRMTGAIITPTHPRPMLVQ